MTLVLFCSRKNEQDEGRGARFSGFRFSGFQLAREGGRLEGGKVGRFKVAGLKVVAGCILIPDSGPLTPAERLVTDCALPWYERDEGGWRDEGSGGMRAET